LDCPACGASAALEVPPEQPLSTSFPDAVLEADEEGGICFEPIGNSVQILDCQFVVIDES
jgi:hypothetical protein